MLNKFSLPLCSAVAIALAPISASALDFTVNQFARSDLSGAQSNFADLIGPNWLFTVAEDFEGFSGPRQIGPDHTESLSTSVGSFTTLNGKPLDPDDSASAIRSTTPGSGSTAIDTSGGKNDDERGRNLSIRQNEDSQPNGGRQNTSSGDDDKTYLDSNDTLGMQWTASDAGGRMFDRLLFTLTDPSDQGKTLTISANGFTQIHTIAPRQPNGEIFNVLIGFSERLESATVWLEKSGRNDGFSIDNATIGAVPLPAAAWLLMFASGSLIAAKRRQS